VRDSEIAHVFKENPEVFEDIEDADYNRLIFFVTHELSKGEDSFWHPYF